MLRAADDRQKLTGFCGASWHEAETGSPILEGALAFFDCRLTERYDGGDHTIFIGEIVAAGFREDAEPLLWYASGYRHLRGDAGPRARRAVSWRVVDVALLSAAIAQML